MAHCFQCVQVGRRDGGLETQGSQGCSRCCDGCGIWRMEKARFVQACWHARVEVEEEACNARTGWMMVLTILWKTVVCTHLRPGRQFSARAVSVLPDLDG